MVVMVERYIDFVKLCLEFYYLSDLYITLYPNIREMYNSMF